MTNEEKEILAIIYDMEPLDNAVLCLKILHLNYIRARDDLKEMVKRDAQRQVLRAIETQRYTSA